MHELELNLLNAPILEEIYQNYLKNSLSVDPSWKFFFESLDKVKKPLRFANEPSDIRIYTLIQAYRTYGHLFAKNNPVLIKTIKLPEQLELSSLGFLEDELNKEFPTCGLLLEERASLEKIIEKLNAIYCCKIGYEYKGLQNFPLEKWIEEKIEQHQFRKDFSIQQKQMILQQLNRSELLESFIHTKYTGQKRFSIEGAETLIPMMEAVVELSSELGVEQIYIGMAHRGRLNVLSNILNKSNSEIFSEFEEGYVPEAFEGSGDVKYHKGFSAQITTPTKKKIDIFLSPNPSHLESVDPIVEGQVKAQQILSQDEKTQNKIIPILIHGDAALAGQGIVYETLQLYKLSGYSTGGTLHFVINNQIGFTTTPTEGRSTYYCTDIAKAFGAPVFHVDVEDPEGCIYATNLAVKIRQQFHCDVFIDLICYRKYGHNESDEPAYTQPLEYQIIRKKKSVREIYRDELIKEGSVGKEIAEKLEEEFTKELQKALKIGKEKVEISKTNGNILKRKQERKLNAIEPVSIETLVQISEKMCTIPETFQLHPKLKGLLQDRLSMSHGKKPIDWGMAEMLAYGSLLWQGVHIRLSGQDVCRGTFSHRHAMWMDQEKEFSYCSLNYLKQNQGRFDVYNSSLSEFAILGFEVGYSLVNSNALVIWEAQFGDFANSAQVMIDQYISSGEQKWGNRSPITLFLPHGYEGQGPEHSSARMERFLTLAADENYRVVNPSTPSQMYHLLRDQALSGIKKPLIVFTPKGLLRLPACTSSLKEISEGQFYPFIEDGLNKENIDKIIFCSGHIYYDLLIERKKREKGSTAIIRIEQLYPIDLKKLQQLLDSYTKVKEWVWAQEEPDNMGAWSYIRPILDQIKKKEILLSYAGRERSASPAVGSYTLHKRQFVDLMEQAFK